MTNRCKPGVMVPAFCSRGALGREQRRVAKIKIRSETRPFLKDQEVARPVMQVRGMADGPSAHFSDRRWVDGNGASRPLSDFVRGPAAGADWLRDQDPEHPPGDW